MEVSVFTLLAVNGIAIVFLYGSRQLYGVVEKTMKVLVLAMVLAFLTNCVVAGPSIADMIKGLLPILPRMDNPQTEIWVLVGLFATTFSVAAAFYQAYLVREKGWTESDRQSGLADSIVGVATLGAITLIIMFVVLTFELM